MFVALDLPDELRAGIEAWGERELDDPALRVVPRPSLHITLAFLGYRPEKDAELVAAALRESVVPAPLVALLDPVGLPGRGKPRLFALPAVSPGAELLQARLSELLAAGRLYEPEQRRFWPHVTVARVRSEGRGSRRPMQVERTPADLPAELSEPVFCRRATLYRSELQPQGARYAPMAQVELSAEGQQ